MLVDYFINLPYELNGFAKSDDDFLVMLYVVLGQTATLADFEPFWANLVAADVEIPDFGRDAFEVLPL